MKPVLTSAAGIVVALVVSGCAPPFDEELNRASGLVRQMTPVGTVGPADGDSAAVSVRFLPPRPTAPTISGVNVQSGFLIIETAGQDRLSFLSGSSQTGSQTFTTSGGIAGYALNQFDVTNTLSLSPVQGLTSPKTAGEQANVMWPRRLRSNPPACSRASPTGTGRRRRPQGWPGRYGAGYSCP